MALRAIMLRKKLDDKNAELEKLRAAAKDLKTREAELEKAVAEAKTDEEKQTVEEAVSQYEKDVSVNETAAKSLEGEIASIQGELDTLERAAFKPEGSEKRGSEGTMGSVVAMDRQVRTKFFGLTLEQRDAFLAREDVKDFLSRAREFGKQKRAVTGGELNIPDTMLELIREAVPRYSKLLKHVRVRPLKGTSRQNIVGTVPEAIWTEMYAKLNELDIYFNQIEMDGYKVGGYIVVPNALLEDSDLNLASEIMDMLSQAIGTALDKAILYGKGSKMPLGIVTRLAQTAQPADYPAKAPAWENLSASHIVKLDGALTDVKFFAALVLNAALAKSRFSQGSDRKFWAMNEKTYAQVVSKGLSFNASGAIVAQASGVLPIVGGTVELLDFIPDGDIIGGYGDLYTLVERAGIQLAQSEHVQFVEDNTVFKATARYDGKPVIPEGFVGININNAALTKTIAFAPDEANTAPAPTT